MSTLLFLEEEEELPPQDTNNPPPEEEEVPSQNVVDQVPFSELEQSGKVYKIFMRLSKIFKKTLNLYNIKKSSLKISERREAEILFSEIEDKFVIANVAFNNYEIPDQVKIIRNLQIKINKIHSLLRVKKK